MPIIQLLVSLLPTLFGLVHTAEASAPAAGSGAAKQAGVFDALRLILAQFPALDAKVEPFLAVVKPIITVYVALSNVFGWNPAVAQLAAQLAADAPAVAPATVPGPVFVSPLGSGGA